MALDTVSNIIIEHIDLCYALRGKTFDQSVTTGTAKSKLEFVHTMLCECVVLLKVLFASIYIAIL